MTAAEIADRLWAKYAADLPAEKRAHAAVTIAEMIGDLEEWPGLKLSIVRDAISSLRAWRETEDVEEK